jgi:peptide deformylase
MAILEIKEYPEPVLRKKAEPIDIIDEEIRQLARDMAVTMYAAPGIGLAAPQVGRSIRMIVVDLMSGEGGGELITVINPEIVRAEGEVVIEEGCLSVPDVREDVTRPGEVTVKGLDLDGKEIIVEADDLFAVCLQHEIDHLNGVLFIDHLGRMKQSLLKKKLRKAAAEKAAS